MMTTEKTRHPSPLPTSFLKDKQLFQSNLSTVCCFWHESHKNFYVSEYLGLRSSCLNGTFIEKHPKLMTVVGRHFRGLDGVVIAQDMVTQKSRTTLRVDDTKNTM